MALFPFSPLGSWNLESWLQEKVYHILDTGSNLSINVLHSLSGSSKSPYLRTITISLIIFWRDMLFWFMRVCVIFVLHCDSYIWNQYICLVSLPFPLFLSFKIWVTFLFSLEAFATFKRSLIPSKVGKLFFFLNLVLGTTGAILSLPIKRQLLPAVQCQHISGWSSPPLSSYVVLCT